jgi:hypothetical protein
VPTSWGGQSSTVEQLPLKIGSAANSTIKAKKTRINITNSDLQQKFPSSLPSTQSFFPLHTLTFGMHCLLSQVNSFSLQLRPDAENHETEIGGIWVTHNFPQ